MTTKRTGQVLAGLDLYKSFGTLDLRVPVISGVSLELYAGEVVLLMGPSGSGKSTLLAMLSGLLPPDQGQVLALGVDLWSLSEADRERFRLQHCGFVFQGYNLLPTLTVWQQMEMMLWWGMEAPRHTVSKAVLGMLDLLGLTDKADQYADLLSGGEKQRAAVGRALLKHPDLFFADEPTSALDWTRGQQIIELLRQVARDHGGAVLIVGHDARLIPYADRVLHLEDGRLISRSPELDLLPGEVVL